MASERLSFTFHSCLGTGGFGEVYLATQHRPGGMSRKVAVKILKSEYDDESNAVRRLSDEGRMLAVLQHPAILCVHELTRVDGRLAMVTEYVDGLDLAKRCKLGRLIPPRAVLGIIAEIAGALEGAWTTPSPLTGRPLNLIHRDIKPENVRISRYGEVKVLDFGIARTTQLLRQAETAVGELPFTPGYAPPEAFTEGTQGHKSDVYALGVTMYRMLTADRLYEGINLGQQFNLTASKERYDIFLSGRLSGLEIEDAVLAVLQELLCYAPDARPSAREVRQRCEVVADEMRGPSYRRWARNTTFGDTGEFDGTLTGRTLVEDIDSNIRVSSFGSPPIQPRISPELRAIQEQSARSSGTYKVLDPHRGERASGVRRAAKPERLSTSAHSSGRRVPRRKRPSGTAFLVNIVVVLGLFGVVTVGAGGLVAVAILLAFG
jgi:serine/threonine protein kinase